MAAKKVMYYNPVGSTFKDDGVTLKVVKVKVPVCKGCYYARCDSNGGKLYRGSCIMHGHMCTPLRRKDGNQVIFVKVEE